MATYGKSARTKQQIFEAAHALFLSRGYAETSLNDIADAAGVAKGTLYNHYHVKSDLLVEAQRLSVARLTEFARTVPAELPVAERICALAFEDVRGVSQGLDRGHLTEGSPEMGLALASMAEAYASIERLRGEHALRRVLRDLYAGFVGDAVQAGELRAGTDAALVAEVVVALYFQELEFIILDPAHDYEGRFRAKADALLDGCRP